MNKAAFAGPLALVLAGLYMVAMSMGAGEEVSLFPGHQMPTRFSMMLGALGVIGGIVVAAEMVRKARESSGARSAAHR